jgi:hypothetical protein
LVKLTRNLGVEPGMQSRMVLPGNRLVSLQPCEIPLHCVCAGSTHFSISIKKPGLLTTVSVMSIAR